MDPLCPACVALPLFRLLQTEPLKAAASSQLQFRSSVRHCMCVRTRNLLSSVSMRTSSVPIVLRAKSRIAWRARGARFLKVLHSATTAATKEGGSGSRSRVGAAAPVGKQQGRSSIHATGIAAVQKQQQSGRQRAEWRTAGERTKQAPNKYINREHSSKYSMTASALCLCMLCLFVLTFHARVCAC